MKRLFTNVYGLLGFIFAVVGCPFFITSVVIWFHLDAFLRSPNVRGEPILLPIIFSITGVVLLLLGGLFLGIWRKKEKTIARVKAGGYYVMATVVNVDQNFAISVNGRHPYIVECEYQDGFTDTRYFFKSENRYEYPGNIIGQAVRVYVDRKDYGQYYVDIQ